MHQTFYIEMDEEISSVVDRLNKSMSKDNYFVVPKRALFLQSIVNLKLLKREADKAGKNVVIVTQDEIAFSMANRAGIEVRANLDQAEFVKENEEEEIEEEEFATVVSRGKTRHDPDLEKKKRLNSLGSQTFYAAGPIGRPARIVGLKGKAKALPKKSLISKLKVSEKREPAGHHANIDMRQAGVIATAGSARQKHPHSSSGNSKNTLYAQQLDGEKEKSLERIFQKPAVKEQVAPKESGQTKHFLWTFVLVSLVLLLGVAGYLIVPSAKVALVPNIEKKRIDVSLHGQNIDKAEGDNIPVRVINKNADTTISFEVKGLEAGSKAVGEKATGKVVIYNEFSSAVQTLVATTRLASPEGKIFLLVKSVNVPGMTNVGGEMKPGAIEAEVIAQEGGAEYNIDPATFKIPGFEGGAKYDKFYAKSATAFAGGTSSSDDQGQVAVISQKDIDEAKAKAAETLKKQITEELKEELAAGEVSLSQAQNITVSKVTTTGKVGAKVGTFEATASGTIQALVFTEESVRSVLQKTVAAQEKALDQKKEITKIDYGSVEPDFANGALELKVYSEVTLTPIIDTDQIRKELLGKKDDELSTILKKYTSIKNASVEFDPTMVTRIPQYPQRVTVQIQPE